MVDILMRKYVISTRKCTWNVLQTLITTTLLTDDSVQTIYACEIPCRSQKVCLLLVAKTYLNNSTFYAKLIWVINYSCADCFFFFCFRKYVAEVIYKIAAPSYIQMLSDKLFNTVLSYVDLQFLGFPWIYV